MPIYRRLAYRLALFTTTLVLISIAYFGYNAYQREHRALEGRFGLALERIVATAALSIDGDAHKEIRTLDDAKGESFAFIREHLRKVQKANYLREDLLYTFNFQMRGDTPRLQAAVHLHQTPYTGDAYEVPAQNRALFYRSLKEGRAGHSKLYSDEFGTWVSAWAPIVDWQGEVIGVLQADYDISRFEKEIEKELTRIVLLSLIAAFLAAVLSWVSARGLEKALNAIREGAQSIEDEKYDYRITLSRKDELGVVAQQFNHMAEVLGERFHLLKFIPRHTLDAVRKKNRDGKSAEVERVNASILFSDIRGYTEMSEGLSDEDVVRMLNHYLRVQAEIVQTHGGIVDKFIGDAVLAVFTGNGHEKAATDAGLEIQATVSEMNHKKVFDRDVHIGIGIGCGSVVYAELGSKERKERTIIGSIVNLSARLCSTANAGEVVVSNEVCAALPDVKIEKSVTVLLKGFQDPVECHAINKSA